MTQGHFPVMLNEVIAALPKGSGLVVDMTFGGGGYSRAILEQTTFNVLGLDRDPHAITRGKSLQEEFPERLYLVKTVFSLVDEALIEAKLATKEAIANGDGVVDAVVMDLGVSSFQFDEADRGFSFMHNGPLDMRMSMSGRSAADIVAESSEEDLAKIFWRYGEEKMSRKIAKAIVEARKVEVFTQTHQLAELVSKVKPRRHSDRIHPATKVFQALRMAVNSELEEIEIALEKAARLLRPSGVVIVVSFHSLEDRIVKCQFQQLADVKKHVNKYRPQEEDTADGYILPFKGTMKPTREECTENARSRSAKMRVLQRKTGKIAA